MPFCFFTQNFGEIGKSVDELWPQKRFWRWRAPPSWVSKFSIFGHVTVMSSYLMQCTKFHQNRTIFHGDMAILRFLKWRPSAILDFKNLQFLSCSPCRHAILLPHTKFHWNRTIGWWVMAKKAIFKMAATAILNFKNFNFLVTRLQSGPPIAIVCRISSKSDNFSLRYGDLTISKMAAVCYLGFLKFAVFSCSPCRHAILLPHTKFRWNLTIDWWVITKKSDF